MKIKKSQLLILDLFRRNVFLSETIRGIALILKKDYPTIYNAIKELTDKKIIKIKNVGKAKICEIYLNPETISVLSFLDEQEALAKNVPNIDKILSFKEFLDDIIIVRSYVKEEESNIDLIIITKENVFNKQKLLENLTSLFLPKIHSIVITQKDFLDMLSNKKPNLGKEIFKDRLLFRNSSRYYELIKQAIEDGFKDSFFNDTDIEIIPTKTSRFNIE